MMTVMTGWKPEEAIKTLEKMNAFDGPQGNPAGPFYI